MKKGVSAIITAILIVLMFSSLIFLAYLWSTTSFSQITSSWKPKQESCLRIENVNLVDKKISVRNCGYTELSDFRVYLDEEVITSDSKLLNPGNVTEISYTKYVTRGDHEIFISSNYAETPKIIFYKDCDVYIYQYMILPYTIDQSNTYYCLVENVQINNNDAIRFSSGVQNSTLDCRNYNITGNDAASTTYGIYLSGSNTRNNIIENCNIRDFNRGIIIRSGSNNNLITNNTFFSNRWGIQLEDTSYNNLTYNTAYDNEPSTDYGRGFELWSNADNNIVTNNVAYNNNIGFNIAQGSGNNILSNNTAEYNTLYGVQLHTNAINNILMNNKIRFQTVQTAAKGFYITWDSNNNNFTDNIIESNKYSNIHFDQSSYYNNVSGGSVALGTEADYRLNDVGRNNYFRNTNFTGLRKIVFYESTTSFNYNNRTDIELWLKTLMSSPDYSYFLTRKLINWNETLIAWNDTYGSSRTATYNITGLIQGSAYRVYNNSFLAYTLSATSGYINFTIYLPANQERNITVQKV